MGKTRVASLHTGVREPRMRTTRRNNDIIKSNTNGFSSTSAAFTSPPRAPLKMRTGVVAGLCVALVVMCLYLPQPCEAQYETLIASVLGKLTGLWHNNSVDFMGHTCHFRRRPKGQEIQAGRSRTKSRSGSSREAIKDFVRKALQNGLITQQDATVHHKEGQKKH
ncbi:hypothetical protein O3P69_004147 [Scylla paramamosain]|uniref:Anti-lipopolysaccharide factor n=1 Tax=Scylla paramamosain TaxID=85552 RepID=A0AAW0UFC5_SCYPA